MTPLEMLLSFLFFLGGGGRGGGGSSSQAMRSPGRKGFNVSGSPYTSSPEWELQYPQVYSPTKHC